MPKAKRPSGEAPAFHEHETGKVIEGLPKPGPCPFCHRIEFGGIVSVPTEGDKGEVFTYHVQCDHCGAEGPCWPSQLAAAMNWNAARAETIQVGERDEAVSLKLCHSLALLEMMIQRLASKTDELQRIYGGAKQTEVGVLYAMQEFIESAKATVDGEAEVSQT